MLTLTNENFQENVRGGVAVVDFWGAWCRPCHAIAPILLKLSEKFPAVTFGKVNVDENRELQITWKINALPTLLFFKDGVLNQRLVGIHAEQELITLIESLI